MIGWERCLRAQVFSGQNSFNGEPKAELEKTIRLRLAARRSRSRLRLAVKRSEWSPAACR